MRMSDLALTNGTGQNVALVEPESGETNIPDLYGKPHYVDQLHVKSTPADAIRDNGRTVANALWDMRDYHLRKAAGFDAAAANALSRAESDAILCEEGAVDMDTILRILDKRRQSNS